LPFRPKRRTRATVAREKGLEPLASSIYSFATNDPVNEAAKYINAEKEVDSAETALAGARDIIAEWISEDAAVRADMRSLWSQRSTIVSSVVRGKEAEGAKYSDYFDWNEPAKSAPSHRVLAMFRGETEGFLKVNVSPPFDDAINRLEHRIVTRKGPAAEQIK